MWITVPGHKRQGCGGQDRSSAQVCSWLWAKHARSLLGGPAAAYGSVQPLQRIMPLKTSNAPGSFVACNCHNAFEKSRDPLLEFGIREARAADDVARLEVEATRVNHISELSADHSFEVRQIKR